MAAAPPSPAGPVLVLGGTGFLGRRVAEALLAGGRRVRVGVRDVARGGALFGDRVEIVEADIRDDRAVERAMEGADGVVNAVSLYREARAARFHDVHVAGAARVARLAASRGAALVHMSGIGADPHDGNAYVRARGRGEEAVRQALPRAGILRSAAMIGPGDALLTAVVGLVRRMPVIPLFGDGGTRLQLVHVEDVAAAVTGLLAAGAPPLAEIGGPRVVTYRALIEEAADACGTAPVLLPMPFAAWRALSQAGRLLPSFPVDPGQVALMARDTVAAPELDLRAMMALPARDLGGVLAELCAASPERPRRARR